MGRLTTWKFLKDQFTKLPEVSTFEQDLTGRTVILTGATSGIGFEIAKHLVRSNPKKIILGCRDLQRGQVVLERKLITPACPLESAGYNQAEVWLLDFAQFKTVASFVERFEAEETQLDLLIQCAGTWFGIYEKTVDGWELNLQSNYLGPVLLILLLLPSLKRAAGRDITPRIVIVGSESHYYVYGLPEAKAPNILEKLNDESHCLSKGKIFGERYFVTKVFLLLFTRQLASLLPSPLTITCATPGFTATQLFRHDHYIYHGRVFEFARNFIARSPELGSRSVLWALFSPRHVVHGKWCANCQVEEESDFCLSSEGKEVQIRVWREAIDILTKVEQRVKSIEDEHLIKA